MWPKFAVRNVLGRKSLNLALFCGIFCLSPWGSPNAATTVIPGFALGFGPKNAPRGGINPKKVVPAMWTLPINSVPIGMGKPVKRFSMKKETPYGWRAGLFLRGCFPPAPPNRISTIQSPPPIEATPNDNKRTTRVVSRCTIGNFQKSQL